ncbi:putative disease resistance protein RGA4 [Dendrobium catenatum]|uniref:putative disease resistance protein RGA4 n=1 Tax=Dendrobium catenatum TaxID=906689 RepID=UPI0009F5F3EC|nr:putative disease resistance protein RGA4 [Dendrobium catenatum]
MVLRQPRDPETPGDSAFQSQPGFLIKGARQIGERAVKVDPNLKRLEEEVKKLGKVSAEVSTSTFLRLIDGAKQEQQRELSEERETGSFPTNDLIGRREAKDVVMQWLKRPSNEPRGAKDVVMQWLKWLKRPSNEHRGTDLYRNISLLSFVGHGGMGKTTLLQHVYNDEITQEFNLKTWVSVSNNCDVKKVIADILESLKKERICLEKIAALQDSLRTGIISKKFLLVLDDIWEEEDNGKWEKLLSPLAHGNIGSRILVTTRMDSVAMLIEKRTPLKNLRDIAGEMVKKLLGSPLAAKVIGGVLRDKLDESHWRKPTQGMTMEDFRGRYFDVLLKKALFDKVKYDFIVRDDYKMHDLIHEPASKFFAQECINALDDERSFLEISETIRHLSVLNAKSYILRKIEKFKHLHSLFLFYKASDEDISSALTKIFEASTNLRLLYVFASYLKVIPEEIGNLKHLR